MMATYPLRSSEGGGTLARKQGAHYPSTLPIFRPWLDEKTFDWIFGLAIKYMWKMPSALITLKLYGTVVSFDSLHDYCHNIYDWLLVCRYDAGKMPQQDYKNESEGNNWRLEAFTFHFIIALIFLILIGHWSILNYSRLQKNKFKSPLNLDESM